MHHNPLLRHGPLTAEEMEKGQEEADAALVV